MTFQLCHKHTTADTSGKVHKVDIIVDHRQTIHNVGELMEKSYVKVQCILSSDFSTKFKQKLLGILAED